MSKHGTEWLTALESKELMYEPEETARVAETSAISIYEDQARELAKKLMEQDIPDGIASCVSRGSDRLGLPVTFQFFGCQAFQDLKAWAAEQGLVLSMNWQDPDPKKWSLTVVPDRKAS